jgi:cyclopropane fatty-acyl-phospholipid synthase-like methyltransferase
MPWPGASTEDGKARLLRCPACTCGFVYPAETADYGAEPTGGESALAFYLQQGAGIWGIASNLSELKRPAGTRLLEIGCGFGFGLDFARSALGWTVLGLDPSPFAAAGRLQRGLPIESRYLLADDPDLRDRFDVVMASEVIEHVASPPAFVRTLRTAMRNGGTLLLTTPDVETVGPATSPGVLLPLLSAGYHIVLQSAASLTALLRGAGFVDVDVRRAGGGQLTAQCRDASATQETGAALTDLAPREQYRRYLHDAAQTVDRDGDLWFGLTARAYREAVNATDSPASDALWDAFSAACRRRFGFDPETGAKILSDRTEQPLEKLVVREPLCLGPVLLFRAFHRLQAGERRTAVEELLTLAAKASSRLRRALQRIGSDDGDAEDLSWVATAEALLCAAERGAANVSERFALLGQSPNDALARRDCQPSRTEHYKRRIFVSLINAARFEESDRLAHVVVAVEARAALPGILLADDELDVLFCAATRELQRRKRSGARALDLLRQLRAACDAARAAGRLGSAATLPQPALNTEILALEVLGRSDEADALRQKHGRR